VNAVRERADDYRAVRGGAFDYDVTNLRCAFRNDNHPLDSRANLGFRVVVSPYL
jgi:formylglycine-generating enzyme required for sulfatase activity